MDEKAKQLILDYQATFGTDTAKRVYDSIKTMSYCDRPDLFVAGQSDVTTYRLGMRGLFLCIKGMIEADPNAKRQEAAEEEPYALD